jgi:hypothetical protein
MLMLLSCEVGQVVDREYVLATWSVDLLVLTRCSQSSEQRRAAAGAMVLGGVYGRKGEVPGARLGVVNLIFSPVICVSAAPCSLSSVLGRSASDTRARPAFCRIALPSRPSAVASMYHITEMVAATAKGVHIDPASVKKSIFESVRLCR